MPRRTQSSQRTSYFHVIHRSPRRRVLFSQPADYRAFLAILGDGLTRHPARLIAYIVMPTYWQLVMGQTDTKTLSLCLHWVTSTLSLRLNGPQGTGGDVPVYQGRLSAIELSAVGDLVRVCRSVERNALHAGLVRRAQDWPWSSLSERLQPTQRVPLVNAPFLCSRAWADYINTPRPGDDAAQSWLTSPIPLEDFTEVPGRFA